MGRNTKTPFNVISTTVVHSQMQIRNISGPPCKLAVKYDQQFSSHNAEDAVFKSECQQNLVTSMVQHNTYS